MGFMAGFGEGFSSAFKQAAQNRAAREQDAFRVAYDSYIRKQEQYDADKKAYDKAMNKAELMAQQYNAPPESIPTIAQWFVSGYTDEYVDGLMKKAKFAAPPPVEQVSDQNNIDPMAGQMGATGLAPQPTPEASVENNPIQQPVPPQAQPRQNTDILGNMLGPDGIFKNMGKSDTEQAQSQVMETAGIDQSTFDQVNAGFTPPEDTSGYQVTFGPASNAVDPVQLIKDLNLENPNKNNFAQAVAVMDQKRNSSKPEDIQAVAMWDEMKIPIEAAVNATDPETLAKKLQILSPVQADLSKLQERRSGAATFVRNAMELEKTVLDSNGQVLTTIAGVVSDFESFKKELKVGFDVLANYIGQPNSQGEATTAVMGALTDSGFFKPSDDPELARQKQEFASQVVLLVFSLGKANGTTGNGFSNNDYRNFMTALVSSNSLPSFLNTLHRIGRQTMSGIDAYATDIGYNPAIQVAMQDDDLKPFITVLTPTTERQDFKDINQWLALPSIDSTGKPIVEQGTDLGAEELAKSKEESLGAGSPVGTVISVRGELYQKINDGPDNDAANWKKASVLNSKGK